MLPTTCPACGEGHVVFDKGLVRCTACAIYSHKLPFWQQPFAWAYGKSWWPRALVVLYFIYLYTQFRANTDYAMNRGANIINTFNLGIHELGHVLFMPFGEFMAILGGSLFQCLFPLLWFGALLWKRWYFATCMTLCWLGFNLYDVATYIADAQVRLLPLATLNSDYDSAHDWYQLLTRMGRLEQDAAIASAVRTAGDIFIVTGLLLGALLIGVMIKKRFDDTSEKSVR